MALDLGGKMPEHSLLIVLVILIYMTANRFHKRAVGGAFLFTGATMTVASQVLVEYDDVISHPVSLFGIINAAFETDMATNLSTPVLLTGYVVMALGVIVGGLVCIRNFVNGEPDPKTHGRTRYASMPVRLTRRDYNMTGSF
jgi:hypothetical protein